MTTQKAAALAIVALVLGGLVYIFGPELGITIFEQVEGVVQ